MSRRGRFLHHWADRIEALRGMLAAAWNLAQPVRRHIAAAFHMEFRVVRLEAKSVR